MAAASNSSTSPIQAQNSPRSRQSRRNVVARGVPSPADIYPPSLSLSEVVDQEPFGTSSSAASAESLFAKASNSFEAESGYLGDDNSTGLAGGDALVESSDSGGGVKRAAWNKPSSGGATAEFGAVMGAESWPALSESARASPKSSSGYSLKANVQGPITVSQEMSVGSISSPKKFITSTSTPISSPTHAPARQKSMKRGGGNSSHSTMPVNGNLPQASPTAGVVVEAATSNPGKSGGSVGESFRDSIQRDASQRGGTHFGNEQQQQQQQQQRGSFRRSNSGPLSRGDGSYHHSNGGRRDQDRGKHDWGNSHRNYGNRESQSPQQRVGSRPFLRGPAPNAPFIPPPPPVAVLPFVPPMVYTDMPSPVYYVPTPHPESVRPMTLVPISPIYLPMAPDPNLASQIVNQIDYYFSNENLVKDIFLRQNMDSEGWVSVNLIAGFKKVMQLTDNIQIILDAIQSSNVVEVQGDKLRRKNDWVKWIMLPAQPPQTIHETSPDTLATHVNKVTLEEKTAN